MKFFIRNDDKVASALFIAVLKTEDRAYSILGTEPEKKPGRKVLRPGEEAVFDLQEGFFLGIEEL